MRTSFVFALLVAACGTTGPNTGDDDDIPDDPDLPPPPDRGFRVTSPDIEILPGQEITYCYYFRTPNTEPMAIKHWKSEMTPGSHHMIMYTTANDSKPPGTVSADECGFGTGTTNVPKWTYSAQTPSAELELPADDGAGLPLAQDIPANTAGYFQMHYLNATDAAINVHVVLDAFALEASEPYTKTAPFITFNGNISIPPGATDHVESEQCSTPSGSKFWMMSTHAHKQAVKTRVLDGQTQVFMSEDWEHPGAAMFTTPQQFYSFTTGKLTYECTYDNIGENAGQTVTTGDSAKDEEMCMASGYFFPAEKAQFCYNSFVVPF